MGTYLHINGGPFISYKVIKDREIKTKVVCPNPKCKEKTIHQLLCPKCKSIGEAVQYESNKRINIQELFDKLFPDEDFFNVFNTFIEEQTEYIMFVDWDYKEYDHKIGFTIDPKELVSLSEVHLPSVNEKFSKYIKAFEEAGMPLKIEWLVVAYWW